MTINMQLQVQRHINGNPTTEITTGMQTPFENSKSDTKPNTCTKELRLDLIPGRDYPCTCTTNSRLQTDPTNIVIMSNTSYGCYGTF